MKSVEKWVELITYIFKNTSVKVVSWRWMSTENRKKRPSEELDFLFNMYKTCGNLLNDFLLEQKINFRWIGDASTLPQHFLDYMAEMVEKFTFDSDRTLIFAVNYGGQNEIIRWVKSFLLSSESWSTFDEKIAQLSERSIEQYMDLWAYPPVDFVIRTKWDLSSRISGFMSRWIGYAELYFEKKLFQDVECADLDKALNWFSSVVWFRNFWW